MPRSVGGTINGTGSFVMKAERVGADTLLAQIVKMVSEAQRSRAPIQRLADKVASYFVPAVLASSVITFIVWAIFGPPPAMHTLWLTRSQSSSSPAPVPWDWQRQWRLWWVQDAVLPKEF